MQEVCHSCRSRAPNGPACKELSGGECQAMQLQWFVPKQVAQRSGLRGSNQVAEG